jgi:hypothetical protein
MLANQFLAGNTELEDIHLIIHAACVAAAQKSSVTNNLLLSSVIESVTKINIKMYSATRRYLTLAGYARCVSNWSSVIFQDVNASLSLARLSVLQAKSG